MSQEQPKLSSENEMLESLMDDLLHQHIDGLDGKSSKDVLGEFRGETNKKLIRGLIAPVFEFCKSDKTKDEIEKRMKELGITDESVDGMQVRLGVNGAGYVGGVAIAVVAEIIASALYGMFGTTVMQAMDGDDDAKQAIERQIISAITHYASQGAMNGIVEGKEVMGELEAMVQLAKAQGE